MKEALILLPTLFYENVSKCKLFERVIITRHVVVFNAIVLTCLFYCYLLVVCIYTTLVYGIYLL